MSFTFGQGHFDLVNELRADLIEQTPDIRHGHAVAMVLWWSLTLDLARTMNEDPKALAREHMETFINETADQLDMQQVP